MKQLAFILMMVLCVTAAQATYSYSFTRITSNCAENVEDQFLVEVWPVGDNASFRFYNNGPLDSSISEIYFYDGSLLDMYSIDDTDFVTVDFEDIGENTNPAKLPGYNPDASLLVVLSATESQTPEPVYGIKPGEWVTIEYTLQSGMVFQNLVDDLASGDVVLGIHVKAIDCDPSDPAAESFSDSFINVPEPATMVLLGLGGLLGRRRKLRRIHDLLEV